MSPLSDMRFPSNWFPLPKLDDDPLSLLREAVVVQDAACYPDVLRVEKDDARTKAVRYG